MIPSTDRGQIDVAKITLKVAGLSKEIKYYGLASGDEVLIEWETNGKELKEIEIFKYPDHTLFQDFETLGSQFSFKVTETAVYGIRLYNANIRKRVCKVSISRTPAHDSLRAFNTQVFWETQHDTSFYTVQERHLVDRVYETKSVQAPQYFYINSGSRSSLLGGKSRITIPVALPKGTVEWYYTFSADRDEEKIKQTTATLRLFSDLTMALAQARTIGFAISVLTIPPGGDVCDVYLLDYPNSRLFEQKADLSGTPYSYKVIGTRKNIMSGVVKITGNNTGTYYLGIKNPNALLGIHVSVEVAAIVLNEIWETKDVVKYDVKTYQVPYLK